MERTWLLFVGATATGFMAASAGGASAVGASTDAASATVTPKNAPHSNDSFLAAMSSIALLPLTSAGRTPLSRQPARSAPREANNSFKSAHATVEPQLAAV